MLQLSFDRDSRYPLESLALRFCCRNQDEALVTRWRAYLIIPDPDAVQAPHSYLEY